MRGDDLIQTQLLMAQAFSAVAITVAASVGTVNRPTPLASIPAVVGMIACISDSTVNTWGAVIAGDGPYTVLGFFNGANWKVVAA
jgi:hypothetical protein